MLHNKKLPKSFWGEAVNTACHTLNRVYFRPDSKRTPYEIWRGRSLLSNTSGYLEVTVIFCMIGRTKTIIESSNVVTNDELCSEPHSENTLLVQEKTKEVEDSIPDDYVGKHNDEELLMLNDTVSVPSSSEPSTPIHETQ